MDLIQQLEANQNKYWSIRTRVLSTQNNLKKKDSLKNRKTRSITNKLIKAGLITKTPCDVCGDADVKTHHPDYNKPELVMFLCQKHHTEWHKNNTPIY